MRPAFMPPPVAAAGPAAYPGYSGQSGYSGQPSAGGYAPPAYADPNVSRTRTFQYHEWRHNCAIWHWHALWCRRIIVPSGIGMRCGVAGVMQEKIIYFPLNGYLVLRVRSSCEAAVRANRLLLCCTELSDVFGTRTELPDLQRTSSWRCARYAEQFVFLR